MISETEIHSLPLSSIPPYILKLTNLLNAKKITFSDPPHSLPRDWRGLAACVRMTSEQQAAIKGYDDKVSKILNHWQHTSKASVGELLGYLERMDRFDVYDDFFNAIKEAMCKGQISVGNQHQMALQPQHQLHNGVDDEEPITYDDAPGHKQQYHAFVLHADEDKPFVDNLISRMTEEGFMICTVDRLVAGHTTQYPPVARLITERCRRTIVILSPQYLSSPANIFYGDYAQALSIESTQHKFIPIMYRQCRLPAHLQYYHKLHYNENGTSMVDFWQKLKQSLDHARTIPSITFSPPALQVSPPPIVELPSSTADCNQENLEDEEYLNQLFMSPNDTPSPSPSTSVASEDCNVSLSGLSLVNGHSSSKNKITSAISKLFRPSKKKKAKRTITVAD